MKHAEPSLHPHKTTLSVEGDVISVIGKIHFVSVMPLYRKGQKLIATMTQIVIDLQQMEHCDSSGLALCTAWVREAKLQDKSIVLINIPLFMQDLIRVYGLDSVLPIKMKV